MEVSRGRWVLEAVLLMVAVVSMASSVIFLRLSKFTAHSLSAGSWSWPPAAEWKWILLVLVCPTLLGHGLVARALRFWRGQVVGVATGAQFLFASIYGWFAFGEIPTTTYPIGAVLIVAGVWVVAGRRTTPLDEELSMPSADHRPDNKSE